MMVREHAVAAFWGGAVKPAIEDVDAGNFLAFCPAQLKTESWPFFFSGAYK
jgi:hypothetical protein